MSDVNAYFNIVYDATFRDLTRVCVVKARRVQDVDDLLQNTYESFYRQLCRHGTDSVVNAKSYLLTILKKELAHYYRFHARHPETPIDEATELIDPGETPEAAGIEHMTTERIWQLVEQESPLSQKVFILFYGYGMSLQQIAEELELTEGAVKSRLLRARNRIRETLRKEEVTA